ncbi:hypothetical protein ACTQ33_16880 [Candidatus Avoscillospira sp. LCP25S3_F1]|uniref:hypothetical protein n=1 Tax=Candidatus Avoscillospira sp. LCP25S3_F1 TaxID=3438825 RepID=UPI003F91D740
MCIENKYCAFIDILGFKENVKNFESALHYYRSYFGAYHSLDKMHDELVKAVQSALPWHQAANSSVQSCCFSDSIILSSSNWKTLLFKICNIMSFMTSSKFVFRGGIGYGKHVSETTNGDFYIVSEGLVHAVEIESSKAKYPRIVLDKSALNAIVDSAESPWDLNHMLIQSEDDLWFVNPFFLNPDIRDIHAQVKEWIEQYQGEVFVDKYLWMNDLCKFFMYKDEIRENPEAYFSGKLWDNPTGDLCEHRFFYPHIFQCGIFGQFNYSLDMGMYQRNFEENYMTIRDYPKFCVNLLSGVE